MISKHLRHKENEYKNPPYRVVERLKWDHGWDLGWVTDHCAMLCYTKSLQSCPALHDPRDGSPPGSPVPGILQARILEWVAISFSNAWKWKAKVKSLSHVQLLTTPWTTAYQAPPSIGFSRQEYWSGVPLPSPYWHYRYIKDHPSYGGARLSKKPTTGLPEHTNWWWQSQT